MLKRQISKARFLTICSTKLILTLASILFINCSQPFYLSELLDGLTGIEFSITPNSVQLYSGETISLEASGGQAPYTYSLSTPIGGSGESLVDNNYTAPSDTTGTVQIKVKDSYDHEKIVSITVVSGSTGEALSISPSLLNMNINTSYGFFTIGGTPPYTYTLFSAIGDGGTGENLTGAFYTAPSDKTGTAIVRVTDSNSDTADATINVIPASALSILPETFSLDAGESLTFIGAGGVPPYTFTINTAGSGTPSIGASDGIFVSGDSAGTDIIVITDNMGTVSDAAVTVSGLTSDVDYGSVLVTNTGGTSGGGALTGTFSFINNGTENGSETVNWDVYVSLDSEIGVGDILAVQGSTSALDVGFPSGDIPFSGTWPIPASDTLYNVIVRVRSTEDLVKTNNIGIITETVSAPAPADIDYIVNSISNSPVSADAGSANTQTFTITNQGGDPGVYNPYWTVYSSDDEYLDGTDTLLSSGSTSALAASGISESITIGGNWPASAGLYYLIVNVSAGDDTNPSNNYTASSVFTINSTSSVVDYKVSNITKAYPNVSAGSFCSEKFDISNIGGANGANEISWTAYASTDNEIGSDTVLGSGTLSGLNSADTSTINIAGSWPDDSGPYYIIVEVTASDDLLTGNNIAYNSVYEIIDPPDYTISSAMFSTGGPVPGELLTYTGTFRFVISENSGSDGGQMIGWEVFASFDTIIDGSDISVVSGSHLPLSASASTDQIDFGSGRWPEMGGYYYLIISINSGDEINSSNNTYISSQFFSSPVVYTEPQDPYNDDYTAAMDLGELNTNELWHIEGISDDPGYDTYKIVLGDNINALDIQATWSSGYDNIDLDLLNSGGSSIWHSGDTTINIEPEIPGDPADIVGLNLGATYYLRVESKDTDDSESNISYTVSVFGHRLW